MPGSVVDPDPGFGAFLTPGSGISFFHDLGSRSVILLWFRFAAIGGTELSGGWFFSIS
jgi:hypothetical protein